MEKNIIIVGGGIAGLSAGCYARMNGYKTAIYEMHNIPGGLCTAWERKGYTWDISMHFVTGSVSGPFFKMWEELGIPEKIRFHYHDHLISVEGKEQQLSLTVDRNKMEQDMLAISPEDAETIKEFTDVIFGPGLMNAANLKPAKMQNILDKLKMMMTVLPMFRYFKKYGKMTFQDFVSRFRHPFLRDAVQFCIDSPGWPMKRFPMIAMAGAVKYMVKEGGTPLGGSQQVMFHMADLFKQLGGEMHLNSRVKNLVLENNRVTGIELADGTRQMADEIIWAGDGHTLIYGILGGKYVDDRVRHIYEKWIPKESMMHIMIGVNRDLSGEPHVINYEADELVTIAGREHKWLNIHHHCFDKSTAPDGKSALEVWYDTDFDYWEELSKDRKAYNAEKKRIADYTVRQLDKRWPGFASQVEVIDVPTPHTYYRYTGNYKGSPDGWCITPDNMRTQEPLRTLPGLDGLKMIGQWTAPFTGTVIAAVTGRQVIQLMCHEEGKKFVTQF